MSLVISSPLVRAGLIAGSLGAVVAAVMSSRGSLFILAVLLLLPVATSVSQAGRLAASLQGLKRQAVNAAVWGVPILEPDAAEVHVERVGAVGAGLLIYLMDAGETKTLLKVAQPRSWSIEENRVVIDEAAYVQWAGKRLARAKDSPAVTITWMASGVA